MSLALKKPIVCYVTDRKALGPAGTFWTYAGVCLAGMLFLSQRLKETKGKTLEEIETDARMGNA